MSFIFNVLLYGLYMFLWIVAVGWSLFQMRKARESFWGAVFISMLYLPGQISDFWQDAFNLMAFEFFIIFLMLFTFTNKMKGLARALMGLTLCMMCINAIHLTLPILLENMAEFVGPLGGVDLTGDFMRKNILNFLFVLECLSVIYFVGHRERRSGKYILQEV